MTTVLKIFLIVILLSPFSSAQKIQSVSEAGVPLITNYLPREYSANVQNWAVIQDNRGVLYFGNVNGVLEYDGVNWRLIRVPNDVVRCLAIDNEGKLYVGGINEIGYLSPDSIGALSYVSLNKYISKEKIDFGDIWRIIVHDDGLYFQTFSTLFLLESNKINKEPFFNRITKNPSLKKWESRTRINPILSIGDRIFVHERNLGLQELINGKLTMLPGGEEFAQDLICIMLPYPSTKATEVNSSSKILIGSLRRGMYLFDGKKFEKFNNEADNYLIEKRLYFKGAILGDGSYALGTQLGGIVVIDQDGKLKKIINKTIGLNSETVWDLFCDHEGNLWAALDNGISKIIYPSAVQIIDETSGFEGLIQDIKSLENKIYIATSSGIFYLQNPSGNSESNKFIPVKNISVQSWNLLSLNSKLLAATNDGVFEITNNTGSIVDENLRYTYCFCQAKSDPSIIYVGLHNGIGILKNDKGKFFYLGAVTDFNNSINNIEEDGNGNLWCNDIAGKIIYLKTPADKNNLKGYKKVSIDNQNIFGGKVKLFKYANTVFFYNDKNIFNYEHQKNEFSSSSILNGTFKDTLQSFLNIYSDDDNNIWSITNNQGKINITEIVHYADSSFIKSYSMLGLIDDDLSSGYFSLQSYVQNNKKRTIWVNNGNILIKYNLDSELNSSFPFVNGPLIRKVSLNGKEDIFDGYANITDSSKDILTKIDFSSTAIMFDYALPSFLNESGNDYQYILEGFDGDWSQWGKQSKKEYTNLPSGKYLFKIRSRNAIGQLSDEAVYGFRVLPPWYQTWWANLIGFLIILLIINYVVRIRVKYLKNKNIVLEKLVTERTAKINEQKDVLEKQAQKLLELDQLKSNFFANISHEFRTPLTLIKGQLENVLRIVKDDVVKKKINIAFTNSNRLGRLINQVLDLSKLESGKLHLDFEISDIVALVKNRVASFDSLAEQKNVLIKFISRVDSLSVNVDVVKIEEVIDNLLSNALKFTPANGSIVLTIDLEKSEYTDSAIISVADTGVGISEEKLPHIFDRFFQADNSSTRQFEGSGLGLAIVKELVELHDGTISVESILNNGTTFYISLPIDENKLLSEEGTQTTETKIDDVQNLKEMILIVEDNFDVRNYIKENLEQHYKIEEAENGEEGIDKAIKIIPDLIISDLMMPKVDGFQLCEKLKNDQRTSHIPIIMLTARADEKSKLEGLKIGADEYLSKPFSAKELELRVGNLIRIRQLLREKYREISILNPDEIIASSLDKEFVEKVFYIIKNHLEDNQFSVQLLADEIGMSVSQLNRKLNALIDQTAGKLIRSTKLEYAAKLIKSKSGNISEIADKVGFSDITAFGKSFKSKYGVSPSDYQKNLGN